MSDLRHEYRFEIDACSPDTLPMSRLAEYMADLAQLLGEVERVHFARLEAGSAVLVQYVESAALPKVRERIRTIATEEPVPDVARAYETLNRRLAGDNAIGSLRESTGSEVIRFPGRERLQPLTFGPFNQPGILDGVLIRVGGRDDTVPVHLQDGDTIHLCNATREMARRLASHLYGATLRVRGHGRWERDADGWLLKRFNITDFEELDEASLSDVVAQLRNVKGSGWRKVDNPSAELKRSRASDEPL